MARLLSGRMSDADVIGSVMADHEIVAAGGPSDVADVSSSVASAAAAAAADMSAFDLTVQLFGGLAFFLYGLNQLSGAMKRLAGKRMKRVIVRLTSNPCVGLLVGMVVTGLSNSLTLVSVLLVGFVGTGLLQFEHTIPVLMGAGIGSTLISLLVALKVTKYGLLLIAAAYFYSGYAKRRAATGSAGSSGDGNSHNHENHRDTTNLDVAECVFGLGLIFYGSQVRYGIPTHAGVRQCLLLFRRARLSWERV